jgi:predicted flap endonuclease-1-like 5' DNA nuclease
MPTPAERKALIFLTITILLGTSARLLTSPPPPDAQATSALASQIAAVESARTHSSSRPRLSPTQKIDVDLAPAQTLDALPGIGPALARRIVADRDSLGPFGSLTNLQRVKGIGPAMASRLAPHVTFSGTPRPKNTPLWRWPEEEKGRAASTKKGRP